MSCSSAKKLVRSKSGLRIVPANDNFRSPFELNEPPWVPDKESPDCTQCHSKFDLITRRHHCRRCGLIFCKNCCETKVALPRMCFVDPVRLCNDCTEVTRKENEFYDKHLKTLQSGALFFLQSVLSEGATDSMFHCKLSSDHRHILFDGQNSGSHIPVDLCRILSVRVVPSEDDLQEEQWGDFPGSMDLHYLDSDKERQDLKLLPASEPNKKQSMLWLAALQKAVKMMFEAQEPSASQM